MRTAYHQQLDALKHSIGDMCGIAGTAMQRATQALLEADIVLAETVISEHEDFAPTPPRPRATPSTCWRCKLPWPPICARFSAACRNVADVDRMRALALHVAKTARRRHPAHAIPDDVKDDFAEMGRIAVSIGGDVKDVVLSGDPEKAARLADEDDAMDELHRHLFTVLMDREWSTVAAAVDVTLLGRYFERFADHAVEIGRRVIFQATGDPVG